MPDIVQIIDNTVALLSGEKSFFHGEKSFQNLQDDTAFPIVYLDEPIVSNFVINKGGYFTYTYHISIFFADKSELDWTPQQHHVVILPMYKLMTEFINRLQQRTDIFEVNANAKVTELKNPFDINLSGIILEIDVIPENYDTNCLPE